MRSFPRLAIHGGTLGRGDYGVAGEGLVSLIALGDEAGEEQAARPRPTLTTTAAGRGVEDRRMDRLLVDHEPPP